MKASRAGCAKSAERIDVLFWMETPGNPRNIVYMGVPDSITHGKGKGVRCGLCEITFATIYDRDRRDAAASLRARLSYSRGQY